MLGRIQEFVALPCHWKGCLGYGRTTQLPSLEISLCARTLPNDLAGGSWPAPCPEKNCFGDNRRQV
jgi:hypothetical protein